MSDGCTVVAEVLVEGMAFAPAAAPAVCGYAMQTAIPQVIAIGCTGSAAVAYAGAFLQSEAGKGIAKWAVDRGCSFSVEVTGTAVRFTLVEGQKATREAAEFVEETKRTYRALNTHEGALWLMRYLSGVR